MEITSTHQTKSTSENRQFNTIDLTLDPSPPLSDTKTPTTPLRSILTDMLTRAWDLYYNTQCRCVNWQRYSIKMLCTLAECVGPRVLSAILRVLARDYAHATSGMPDLILYKEGERKARFAEVKGPRDRLSDKQRVWLDVLIQAGADVHVIHVTESDDQKCEDDDLVWPDEFNK